MENFARFNKQWLEILSPCGAKVQMEIIAAIVRFQTEGILPDFKGMKLALFRVLVRDLESESASAEQPAAESAGTACGSQAPFHGLRAGKTTPQGGLRLTPATWSTKKKRTAILPDSYLVANFTTQ